MIDFITKKIKKNSSIILYSLICFLIFFVIYRIVPMTYDGWASKYTYPTLNGLPNYLYYLINHSYFITNGRVVSNLVCGILESFSSEIPLDFFNAACVVLMYIFTYLSCFNKKGNKFKYGIGIILFASMILFISPAMRTEVLFYANSAYVVPIPLILLYYLLLQKVLKNSEKEKSILVYMSIIGFSIGMWMEHISFGFAFVISLITLGLFIKNNSKKWKVLIPNVFANVGFLLMLFSPGLDNNREIVSSAPLLDIMTNNIKNLYVDVISNNLTVFLLMFVFISCILLHKNKKKKLDYIVGITSIATSFIILISVIYKTFYFGQLEFVNTIFPPTLLVADLVPVLVMLAIILFIIIYSAFSLKNKNTLFYVFLIGISCLIPILITPNTGPRISSIGFFAFAIMTVIYFYEVKDYKLIKALIIIVFILAMDNIILINRRIYDTTAKRDRILKNTLEKQEMNEFDYSCYISIPIYNNTDMFRTGSISQETIHYDVFLDAYHLDQRTKILFYNKNISAVKNVCLEEDELIIKTDMDLGDEIKLNVKQGDSYYNFEQIEDTDWIKEDYSIKVEKGYYLIDVYYRNTKISDEVITDHFEIYID